MNNKFIFKNIGKFSLLLALFAVAANAQSSISETKKALIGELIILTKMDSQVSDITDKSLESIETVYPITMAQAIDSRTDLTAQQKEDLKATLGERFKSFSSRYRQRIKEKIDYVKYIEETVYPLYDKFFDESELKDLVAFYKTPTGQKVIRTMPEIYGESLRLTQQNLLPQILVIIDELVQEDLKNLQVGRKSSNH